MNKFEVKDVFYFYDFYKLEQKLVGRNIDYRYISYIDEAVEELDDIVSSLKQTLTQEEFNLIKEKYIKGEKVKNVIKKYATSESSFKRKTDDAFSKLDGYKFLSNKSSKRAKELIQLYQPIYLDLAISLEKLYTKNVESLGLHGMNLEGVKGTSTQSQRDYKKIVLFDQIEKLQKRVKKLQDLIQNFECLLMTCVPSYLAPVVYKMLVEKTGTMQYIADKTGRDRGGVSRRVWSQISRIEINDKVYKKAKDLIKKSNLTCK